MKSILSTFLCSFLIVLFVVSGALGMYLFDRRPADFPAIHEHFLFLHFDWTAPDSLKVVSFKNGESIQHTHDWMDCRNNLQHIRAQLDEKNKIIDQAHAQELQIEKQLLKNHNDALVSRKKETITIASINKMQIKAGNSCQRAEQVIRRVIQ